MTDKPTPREAHAIWCETVGCHEPEGCHCEEAPRVEAPLNVDAVREAVRKGPASMSIYEWGELAEAAMRFVGDPVGVVRHLPNVREPSRWCFFHWSSVKSDPEVTYCRIAMWSGINENPWCQLGEVLVVPLGGDV